MNIGEQTEAAIKNARQWLEEYNIFPNKETMAHDLAHALQRLIDSVEFES